MNESVCTVTRERVSFQQALEPAFYSTPERKALNCNDSSLVIVDRIVNDVREK